MGAPSYYDYNNCWTGPVIGGEYVNASVGAPKSDPEQGVITVFTTTLDTENNGPSITYKTPTVSGPLSIASVTWPLVTLITSHDGDDTAPVTTFLFNLQTRAWERPSQCRLFPIALNDHLIQGLQNHYGTHETNYGIESGNFGWLSWDGSTSISTLIVSLTPPGNSTAYINSADATNHILSVGDWVAGRPEVENNSSAGVERAMSGLAIGGNPDNIASSYVAITVPLWDETLKQRDSLSYRISGFAWISIDHYSLAQPNLISFYYWGRTACPDIP